MSGTAGTGAGNTMARVLRNDGGAQRIARFEERYV